MTCSRCLHDIEEHGDRAVLPCAHGSVDLRKSYDTDDWWQAWGEFTRLSKEAIICKCPGWEAA